MVASFSLGSSYVLATASPFQLLQGIVQLIHQLMQKTSDLGDLLRHGCTGDLRISNIHDTSLPCSMVLVME